MIETAEVSWHDVGMLDAWRALWSRCGASVFEHPDWLVPWVEEIADREAWLVTASAGERLVGLAPLVTRADGSRVLWGGAESDYHGVLTEPSLEREVLDALARRLTRGRRTVLDQLEARSPALTSGVFTGAERHAQDICPYLPVQKGAGMHDLVPSGFLRSLRQSRRRAARAGLREVIVTDDRDVDRRFAELARLHSARWSGGGVLASVAIQRFLRRALHGLAGAGLLRWAELRRGEQVVSSVLAFATCGRVACYVSGFDPAVATYSPGRIGIAAVLEQALGEGAAELDFLRGTEPYKYEWGAVDRWTHEIVLA